MTNQQQAMRISIISIAVNFFLMFCKLAAGIFAHSTAMVSDAAHSASDVLSTVVVVIGVRLAAKAPDHEHPYGHQRIECAAAQLLAVALGLTGIAIGINGVRILLSGSQIQIPGMLALGAAVISIMVKELLYRCTARIARRIRSNALMADAWHHRSDALSSIGSFIGILGARIGFPVFDPLASIVICIFIVKAAADIYRDATERMIDRACDDATVDKIRTLVLQQEGVLRVDKLKTRLFGDKMYVEIEICADGQEPLSEAHAAAHRVHDAVEQAFPDVLHCMVHVNPTDAAASSPETRE